MPTYLIVITCLVACYVAMIVSATIAVFMVTMYRSPRKPRTRECTNMKDAEQVQMFSEGIQWANNFSDMIDKLELTVDELSLYGEYVNFGYSKCAVILQGRTESLTYSYYFADVYSKHEYNILVIDVRAHGLSDGRYHTSGVTESEDLVEWIKLIHDQYGIDEFLLHGVCVGGAIALYANSKCADQGIHLIKAIVTDGLFITNYEIYSKYYHMFAQPAFPALVLTFYLALLLAKANLFKNTPIRYVTGVNIPILFMWSVKDIFCKVPKDHELFESCSSKVKKMHLFPRGRHSHVRSSQPVEYDSVISEFLVQEVMD